MTQNSPHDPPPGQAEKLSQSVRLGQAGESGQSSPASQENHAPQAWHPTLESGALAVPPPAPLGRPQAEAISVASVWQMPSTEAADAALSGQSGDFVYRRDGHPNASSLAGKLAELHAAQSAVLTAQGMSAIGSVALSLLAPGATVWVGDELYGRSHRLFHQDLKKWGVAVESFKPFEPHDLDRLADSQCDLIFVETLTNPRLNVANLPRLAECARSAGAKLVVDNTFATHLLCQPLAHGADVVVESLSKQVNGHSDAMLGLVCCNDAELAEQITGCISSFGMASSPLDCYLTHRGLLSLAVRMERACANAQALAQRLTSAPGILHVDYPGLSDHPQHAIARSLLRGAFGWMLSIELDASFQGPADFFERLLPEIVFLPSLGDASTTLSHPASTSHRGLTPAQQSALGITANTVRISCGLEPTSWLIEKFLSGL